MEKRRCGWVTGMTMKKNLMCVGLIVLSLVNAASATTTITLQEGLNGYTGTDDNTLQAYTNDGSNSHENRNLGGLATIELKGVPWLTDVSGSNWIMTGLLRFRNIFGAGAVPDNVTITSAKIQLKVTAVSGSQNYKMSRMLVDWAEGTGTGGWTPETGASCFNYRSYNTQEWGSVGLFKGPQSGTDYASDGTIVTMGATGTVEFDVTGMVQAWQTGTPNYGVYLFGNSSYYNAASIASSEYATAADRPKLIITYAAADEVYLQNGVNGYTGTDDNSVRALVGNNADWGTRNYGDAAYLDIAGVPWVPSGNWFVGDLVRFNNLFGTGVIPVNANITSAKLQFTGYSYNGIGTQMRLYRMKTDWAEGTKNGTTASAGESCYLWQSYNTAPWGGSGAPEPGIDFDNTSYSSATMQLGTIEFDVTNLIQTWQSGVPNYGMYFYCVDASYSSLSMVSSDNTTAVSDRPRLIVQYTAMTDPAAMTVAQYRMDQGIGGVSGGIKVKDISGHGHDVFFNSTNYSLESDDPFGNSHSQSLFRPDASLGTVYGLVSSPETINFNANGARTFTMSGWFKPTVNTADVGLMHYNSETGGISHLILKTDADSKIVASTYLRSSGTWVTVTSANALPLNQWTHVAMVDYNGSIRLYVDGIIQGSADNAYDLPTQAKWLYVGYTTNQGNPFIGYIDDVRICDDAMSVPQILNDYTHTFTVTRTVYADAAEFGGFDPDNATTALQNALNCDEAVKVIVPNKGTPWYVDPLFVDWSNGMDIEFQSGAVVMAKSGSFLGSNDVLLRLNNLRNMTITGTGATLQMRKGDYVSSEFRHTLSLLGVDNVTVDGLTLKDSGGDGIYVANGLGGILATHEARDVTIRNAVCSNHHRQGMSVISVDGLLVDNCTVTGTNGTAPQSGIDIEPDDATYDTISDITIRNSIFSSNAGQGIQVYLVKLSDPSSVMGTIENCTVYANGGSGIYVYPSASNLLDKDNLLVGNGGYGIYQHSGPARTVTYSGFWGNTGGPNNGNVTRGTGCLTAVQPFFASTTFGGGTYLNLAGNCPSAITHGASDGSFMGAKPPVLAGDVDNNGVVDTADLSAVLANLDAAVPSNLVDQDGDGQFTSSDLAVVLANL